MCPPKPQLFPCLVNVVSSQVFPAKDLPISPCLSLRQDGENCAGGRGILRMRTGSGAPWMRMVKRVGILRMHLISRVRKDFEVVSRVLGPDNDRYIRRWTRGNL